MIPSTQINATSAATCSDLPNRAATKSATDVMFCPLAMRAMRKIIGKPSATTRMGPI